MKSLLTKYSHILKKDCSYSWTILIVRLVIGVAFMMHGWGKIQNPLAWMGPDSAVPAVFQALAAISEFGGGLAWVLGLLVPVASLGMFFTMGYATFFHASQGHPFVGPPPTFELALVFCIISLFILVNGPGKYSLDYKIFSR